jgi:transcriptional regulator with PAS, ATPase and Fis domain
LADEQTAPVSSEPHANATRDDAVATIVGDSAAMRTVRERISRIAAVNSNVLIFGETGTGKELVARTIHATSGRRAQPFIPVNCGAIPADLLESQLFGHVRGAFTSADQASPGLFVLADRGTLFLDEIGELPLPLQSTLLRVIQDREVWPVGATASVAVDVRLIAATSRNLREEVDRGQFRADLFYRLNVAHVALPPLRERLEDLPLLVSASLTRLNAKVGGRFTDVEPDALALLVKNPWKGNVRELENVLERSMVFARGPRITAADLPAEFHRQSRASEELFDLKEATQRFEDRYILETLARAGSDKKRAAHMLGISVASLYRRLERLQTSNRSEAPMDDANDHPEAIR